MLATVLSILGHSEGTALMESLNGLGYYLIDDRGDAVRNGVWRQHSVN